ncbi:helix-turn-helix domain-containing protein [Ancylobacter amanitiformis]|uniref:Transcriptional regulator with XRE-family HTH domain n=1 Tax=Ancylobacter amanitiformis TaxID=217069 RepID=A0ABU0LQH8_9HYPH|nr:helix-turn-helix transcriptional regulator [Ancylobacter amanitiformis]MDQ0510931.1 transcriptional regulator with XRE-family HTH domain [Ancylobacter amanitiformis]
MLKTRVLQRLEALSITQWEAARRAGLHRNFVYDLMEGRKQKPQQKTLLALARALQCSVDYLIGNTEEIGSPPPVSEASGQGLPVVGIIEEGAWRRPLKQPRGTVLIQPDARYTGRQSAYLFRGDPHAGLEDGMFVLAVDAGDYERQIGAPAAGNPVIVELRRKALNEVQTVVRPWASGLEMSLRSTDVEAQVVAIVAAAFRLY